MCGLLGFLAPQGPGPAPEAFERALTALRHRGPDGQGVWRAELGSGATLGFGHTRLSIIDLAGGAQPLTSHDGRFVIAFNGEIYNYVELRAELQALGHAFATSSDTEVVVEAVRAWGEAALPRLRGMFAFALFDHATSELLLARDAFGKKPLFLADAPRGLLFGSEIEPLLELMGERAGLDLSRVGEYLAQRYLAGPHTFFRGVRKLPPGSLASWRPGGALETRVWFTPPMTRIAPERMTLADAEALFGQVLDDAVRLRLRSDAPFGAFLSGGLDSSMIVALMQRHVSRTVSTYSVGFDDPTLNELPYAAEVAQRLGARHFAMEVTPQSFFAAWPEAIRRRGAPVSEASDIPLLLLARAAGREVKVVLTGEGADELLGGYPKYMAEPWIGRYRAAVPGPLHSGLVAPLLNAAGARKPRLRILARQLGERSAEASAAAWFASLSAAEVERLTGAPAPAAIPLPSAGVRLSRVRELQLRDQLAWLPDNLLERADRMLMAGSVEGRMPFMDVVLAETAARLPEAFLAHGQGKRVLRVLAGKILPPRIVERPKIGFKVPLSAWFRGPLRHEMQDLLGPGARVRDVLNGRVLDGWVSAHMAADADHGQALWTIANLELFLAGHADLAARPAADPQSRGLTHAA